MLRLRAKMVSYYPEYGIDLSPDEIIITTGGSEAVEFAYIACLDPGDEIIVTDPSYANYLAFAQSCGAVMKPIHTSIEDGFKLPPVEKFEEQITPKTKAILICNPNNPTGYLYTREEMLRIRDIVKKHNLVLISDEVYREFVYSDEPYLSAMNLEGIEDQVILVDSVSKRYSECGIRIGALVTRNKDLYAAAMKLAQARLSPPLLGQLVAEASIDVPKSYLQGVYDEYIARRDFLVQGLREIPGVSVPLPGGAFYAMAALPVEDAEDFCRWCLTDFCYKDEKTPEGCTGETIMMAPAAGFYSTPGLGRDQVRLAYVLRREDLGRALLVLRKALEKYPG
jgi:aspartate aminotransferase